MVSTINSNKNLKAIQTNCHTNIQKIVDQSYGAKYIESLTSWWFFISPGVTGFESFKLSSLDIDLLKTKTGWEACFGTKDLWDKLFIPLADLLPAVIEILSEIDKLPKEKGLK